MFFNLQLLWVFFLKKQGCSMLLLELYFIYAIVLFFGFWFTPFQYFYVVFIPEIMEFFQKMRLRKFNKTVKLQTKSV